MILIDENGQQTRIYEGDEIWFDSIDQTISFFQRRANDRVPLKFSEARNIDNKHLIRINAAEFTTMAAIIGAVAGGFTLERVNETMAPDRQFAYRFKV